jgi:hypothetical protein
MRWVVNATPLPLYPRENPGIVRLKRGGTSLRENAGFKGKQANVVGTQLMKTERQVTPLLPCYYYDVYTSPASAWLSWHTRRFEWTGPFLWKTKSSLRVCHHISNALYPLYRRLGEPQGRSGWVRIISPPPRFDTRTVHPVASRYTDWAIPAHNYDEVMY